MRVRVTKNIYGNVALLSMYCPQCKGEYIVLDGIFQCCGNTIVEKPKNVIVKRIARGEVKRKHLSVKLKNEIILKQDSLCIYCGERLNEIYINKKGFTVYRKVHFDHFVSWNYSGDSSKENIVAACSTCNHIKSDLYFETITIASQYIAERRKKNEK